MSYGTVQAEKVTTESGYSLGAGNASSFKNRIINGRMEIDQRYAGASVTITAASAADYVLDRFYYRQEAASGSKVSVQRSTVAPAGFINSMLLTSLSSYSLGSSEHFGTIQAIEGLNFADMAWGTASAKSVTLSFWVRSSVTGTFGGHFANSSGNRSYVYSYTINAANTWEYKTVTVPGDTSGVWDTNNGIGLYMSFSIGAGSSVTTTPGVWNSSLYRSTTGQTSVVATNGATFYLTGVQLEVGTVATSFDFRSFGTELALCQRYFEKSFTLSVAPGNSGSSTALGTSEGSVTGMAQNRLNMGPTTQFKVTKRAIPTMQKYGNSSGDWIYALQTAGSWAGSANTGLTRISDSSFIGDQQVVDATTIIVSGHWTASAEL